MYCCCVVGCGEGHQDIQVESASMSAELPVYFSLDSWADSIAVYLTFEKGRITMLNTHKKSGETDTINSAIAVSIYYWHSMNLLT